MMKHNLLIFFYLVTCLGTVSCNDFDTEDPNLYGTWSNGLTKYTFNENKSYSLEYEIAGDSINPVYVDSIFGEYSVDNKRTNLTFDQKGYKLDSNDLIIYEEMNSTTWNYKITVDLLEYTTNTSQGELNRHK